MTLENELRLSFYKEIGVIDSGHAVKLVQHIESNRIFVLKTMKIYDLSVFKYLQKERIPGVPVIEDLIEDDGTLYVIEEYISGENLRCRIDTVGPFSECNAVKIISQLCDILLPLHSQIPPIVHRDLKPSNIILKSDGRIALVDFNSAKESDSEKSRDTVLIGTVGYAAPEQFGFSSSQPATDIYAIGVLLNELVTGRLPSENLCTGKLQSIIKICLEMDPTNRFQSVQALKAALNSYMQPPISPRAPSAFKFLPPGFRTKSPAKMIFAVLWYVFIAYLSINLQVQDTYSWTLIGARILCFVVFFVLTLWSCNYLNVWDLMPLSKSSNPFLKIIGVVFWGFSLSVTVFFFGLFLLTFLPAFSSHSFPHDS